MVVVIIGILAAIALPLYFTALEEMHNREAQAVLIRLGSAQRTFMSDYPGWKIQPFSVITDADFTITPSQFNCPAPGFYSSMGTGTPGVIVNSACSGYTSGYCPVSNLRACGYVDAITPSRFAGEYIFYFCDALGSSRCCEAGRYAAMDGVSDSTRFGRYVKGGTTNNVANYCAWVDANGDVMDNLPNN